MDSACRSEATESAREAGTPIPREICVQSSGGRDNSMSESAFSPGSAPARADSTWRMR